MTSSSLLAFAAALFSGALAVAVLFRKRRSIATWCFFAGMGTLSVESALGGMSLQASHPEKVAYLQSLALVTKSFWPGFWLAFSLSYSRGNYLKFIATWKYFLAAAFLLPIGIALGFRSELIHLLPPSAAAQGWSLSFGGAGRAVNALCLIAAVMVLSNLEKTFRSTVGTMRWRIKFMVLGLAVIFAGRIYSLSQELLFSHYDLTLDRYRNGCTFHRVRNDDDRLFEKWNRRDRRLSIAQCPARYGHSCAGWRVSLCHRFFGAAHCVFGWSRKC